MNALYLVLPLALIIATGAVLAFWWSVRSGQLDDLDTPACRLLIEDEARKICAPLAPPRNLCAKPSNSHTSGGHAS